MIQRIQECFFVIVMVSAITLFHACKSKNNLPPLFEVLHDSRTGLHFTNKLTSTREFNLFKYMYFYNGAGVGAGDFNNDGRIDLFFASNQGDNKMYINEGNLRFTNVTAVAQIPQDGGWSTGVSVADVNDDGFLDIYICRVGQLENLKSHNQLLICGGINKKGVPVYADKAAEYGLSFSGFSTQSAFFDYDQDGDLDMYLLNHSIHQNGSFGLRKQLLAKPHLLSGDRMFRNNGNNTFTDVTRESGIESSVLGYGLGIAVADINLDGYPDLYIGNDFHENDYLYINQRNGRFKDDLKNRMMHTSQYSMGVDVADVNNDAYPEIISMDMLPDNPYILKRSLGEDTYDMFNLKIGYGYHHQYTRNNLQLNRKNGMFSEVGLYAGVAATDWSWAPLWVDFNNDGLKDLFISNGIPKRMNDIDYISYISDQDMQEMIRDNKMGGSDMALIDKFPKINIPNKFFVNQGNLKFRDIQDEIQGNVPTYSNGSVYADFDNDGDLDIVVNNIDEPALLYNNKSNDIQGENFLRLTLQGPAKNRNAVGARVVIYSKSAIKTYEKYPVKGFLSSMETPLHIGLGKAVTDSAFLIWPDNTFEAIKIMPKTNLLTVKYRPGLPAFDFSTITAQRAKPANVMKDITDEVALLHIHKENPFVEFDREPLIPHMVSKEGPALVVGDINKDGLDDVFIGSSKGEKNCIFLQDKSGRFNKSLQPALDADSVYEDVDACMADVNNDGNVDLVIASGGNEYYGQDKYLMPRVYLNNANTTFVKRDDAFDNLYITASCVVPCDFNGDGYVDLFIGGRAVPWEYGKVPRSYLLENDGTGKFKDVTIQKAGQLQQAGFVTKAIWFDMDNDKDKDLIVCCEWGGIDAFINNNGSFTKKALTGRKGWWNFILPVDINNDGNIDFIAGNLGLNSRLKASVQQPVRLYYNDFDGNGKKEQVLTYYVNEKELPFANKSELEKQIPLLKKKFLYAKDFAGASLKELFTSEKLEHASVLRADYFSNAILINKGQLNFELRALPWQAQLSTYKDAVTINANNDSLPDILLMGNFYENNIEMGRYDADFGSLLLNHGNGTLTCEPVNGVIIKGQVRHIKKIQIARQEALILVENNDSTKIIRLDKQQ